MKIDDKELEVRGTVIQSTIKIKDKVNFFLQVMSIFIGYSNNPISIIEDRASLT